MSVIGVWDVMSNEDAADFVAAVLREPVSFMKEKGTAATAADANEGINTDDEKELTSVEIAQHLVDMSLQLGSMDNISVIVAKLGDAIPSISHAADGVQGSGAHVNGTQKKKQLDPAEGMNKKRKFQ